MFSVINYCIPFNIHFCSLCFFFDLPSLHFMLFLPHSILPFSPRACWNSARLSRLLTLARPLSLALSPVHISITSEGGQSSRRSACRRCPPTGPSDWQQSGVTSPLSSPASPSTCQDKVAVCVCVCVSFPVIFNYPNDIQLQPTPHQKKPSHNPSVHPPIRCCQKGATATPLA